MSDVTHTQDDLSGDDLADLAADARWQRFAQRQVPRRASERAVRYQAAALCGELIRQGFSCPRIAQRIGLAPRTLSHWHSRLQLQQLDARLRGRPPLQSSFTCRHEVLEVFEEVGPHVGLPTLRATFPEMPRGELIDLQAAYRVRYRVKHRISVEELHWTQPGRAWAMDHADPPALIDGWYSAVLAVRDLASGVQLAWLPVLDQTAELTARALEMLFICHGAPLVLKSDNGSAFISRLLEVLLNRWQVVPLFSPPRMPQYNGSCEAGIAAMKMRTTTLATHAGRFGHWASDDLAAACCQANEFHRAWGEKGPTRSEVWAARQPITAAERAAFAATLAQCARCASGSVAVRPACGSAAATEPAPRNTSQPPSLAHGNLASAATPADGNSTVVADQALAAADLAAAPDVVRAASHPNKNTITSVPHPVKPTLHGSSPGALVHRRAVRQALLELGLLSITRRSISLPIGKHKSAKIT